MTLVGHEITRDVARWLISGALVLSAHGAAVHALSTRSDLLGEHTEAVTVFLDLAPVPAAPVAEETAMPIGPPQPTQDGNDQEEIKDKRETAKLEEPVPDVPPPPPPTKSEVVLPTPKPPEPKTKKVVATAPLHQERVARQYAAQNPKYGELVAAHLRRHNSLTNPTHDGLVTLLSFALNRQGRLVSSSIARGSGDSAFDRDALAMLQRAQPFPTPPPDEPNQQFQYTVPIRYKSR
jgi:protein TonB